MKLINKVKLKEDGTVWDIETIEHNTVLVKVTEEYESYYRYKYSSGSEFPQSLDNEYNLDEVEIFVVDIELNR